MVAYSLEEVVPETVITPERCEFKEVAAVPILVRREKELDVVTVEVPLSVTVSLTSSPSTPINKI